MLDKRALDLLGERPGQEAASPYSGWFSNGYPTSPGRTIPGDAYKGASRFDREVAAWTPANHSADLEILAGKTIADARAKDASRNDAFIANASHIHKDSIVGDIFLLNLKPNRIALGLGDTKWDDWESEFQEEVESLFTLDAESRPCFLDAQRMLPFSGQVRLAIGIFDCTGEVLTTSEWIKDKARPFRSAVQFVDVDRLLSPPGEFEGPGLRRGVYRDKYGAPTDFSICDTYPGDPLSFPNNGFEFTKVPRTTPWGREQVFYQIDPWRAEQTRGISEMVTALSEWKMTKGFRRVTLQNAVVNATYAASLESEFPVEAFQAIGMGQKGIGEAVNEYAGAFLSAIDQYTGGKSGLMLDGVKIPHLFPGTKFKMSPAGTPGGIGTGFEDSLLRYIAAGLGVTFEEFTGNYSNTNYSSIKAAAANIGRRNRSRKRLVADNFANYTLRLWFEENYVANRFSTLPRTMPSPYLNKMRNLDAYIACDWIGAGQGMIDELHESQGAMLRLGAKISTYEEEYARRGKDWRKAFRQMGREQAYAKVAKVILPSDTEMMAHVQQTTNAANGTPRKSGDGSGAQSQ